jgi:hypothetical protein
MTLPSWRTEVRLVKNGGFLARVRDTEPARWAEIARTLIGIGVGADWIAVDQLTTNWVVTGVGLVSSWLLTVFVRSSVYSEETVQRLLAEAKGEPRPGPGAAAERW